MTTRTITVEHPETHYPTDAQSKAALREELKGEGLKLVGDAEFYHVVTTSGGPSKVRAVFESEPASNTGGGSASADARNAKPESKTTTKTVGGKAS